MCRFEERVQLGLGDERDVLSVPPLDDAGLARFGDTIAETSECGAGLRVGRAIGHGGDSSICTELLYILDSTKTRRHLDITQFSIKMSPCEQPSHSSETLPNG